MRDSASVSLPFGSTVSVSLTTPSPGTCRLSFPGLLLGKTAHAKLSLLRSNSSGASEALFRISEEIIMTDQAMFHSPLRGPAGWASLLPYFPTSLLPPFLTPSLPMTRCKLYNVRDNTCLGCPIFKDRIWNDMGECKHWFLW